MRPLLVLLGVAAALGGALPAAAALQPIARSHDEPRVREGTIPVGARDAQHRVEVIVELAQPPLARYEGRALQTSGGFRARLNVRAAASQLYLQRLQSAQSTAVHALRREIPSARVGERLQIVLNAIAVELPVAQLPKLVRMPFAARVSPSITYKPLLNTSPDTISADAFGGAGGEGMKIGIIDDGVDRGNAFFSSAGFQYPPGFPKGNRSFTTPKVIVARAYPSRSSGAGDRRPFDPNVSFHGTHVAGIAAGNTGTTAPAGDDHPTVAGLSGVAPRAWIGSYRVFTTPSPIGNVGNTPQVAAAFEQAVRDGMDVVNFSGGGTEIEPTRDALLRAVENTAAAGVVPVISAGNERDQFGLGTAGSPGTATSSISVAAASNSQVFSGALEVLAGDAPATLKQLPMRQTGETLRTGGFDKTIVDVGTIVGTDGRPVDRLLCGPPGRVNEGIGTLPRGSLAGAVALVSRGVCSFVSKAARAQVAGAVGIVLVDNRPGEATGIPIELSIPAAMIADLDGARLREYLGAHGGRTTVRVHDGPLRIDTGRFGVITSFSSAGPTSFGHKLKPDVAAPGGQILSATTRGAGGPFAVFDGTSMAAPHVAGLATLLKQRHPTWTPQQIKSALMTTAGPAWADTARTTEAPVLLQGAGLVDLVRADTPLVFTAPSSLSFADLDVTAGARSALLQVVLSDAGGGSGTWEVALQPQAATAGTHVDLPGVVQVAPGGETQLAVTIRADSGAAAGENYGFVVLRRAGVVRRIPYFVLVTRPAFANVAAPALRRTHSGDTRRGESRVGVYRYPSAPFGPAPNYFGATMAETGAERVFSRRIGTGVVNFGVVALPRNDRTLPHPWVLGSRDENDVAGAAATPVDVNSFSLTYRTDVGVAGAVFPRAKTYFVVVDSGSDPFNGTPLAGPYTLRSWIDDVRAPRLVPLTTRVAAGRPTLAFRAVDRPARGSGVNPLSLLVGYGVGARDVLVGAVAYDDESGLAIVPLPPEAPALPAGRRAVNFLAADFQESKNVSTPGDSILPNTAARDARIRVVNGPAVTWVLPQAGPCVRGTARLVALASSTARIRSVRFFDGSRRVGLDRSGTEGLFVANWNVRRVQKGLHRLRAVTVDARGRRAAASVRLRLCR